MVMTILEARVRKENWNTLKTAYQQAAEERDSGLVQSFLVQGSKDNEIWCIITIWESREALNAMRESTETPRGVLIFRSANAEPSLSVFDIAQHLSLA